MTTTRLNGVDLKYITPLTIRSNKPAFITDTQNLRRFSSLTGAQRWELEITFTGGKNDNVYPTLLSHFELHNFGTAFQIAMPQSLYLTAPVNNTYTIDVTTAIPAGTKTLTLTATHDIPIGWFVRLGNAAKVYSVVATTSTTITLNTGITTAYDAGASSNTVIAKGDTYTDIGSTLITLPDTVAITVVHDTSATSVTYSGGVMQNAKWTFIERLV